ncbi:hypothetical protein F2Q69_00022136 [Brassica cretica]|uniref:Uncharacterized protein n=1 Tax=Brassica cretica TaxID=69181 RepID=A0A8S9QEH2_BRACR|nr:hypothetical protein F2Q69_00022136 [Brassica cretica]
MDLPSCEEARLSEERFQRQVKRGSFPGPRGQHVSRLQRRNGHLEELTYNDKFVHFLAEDHDGEN